MIGRTHISLASTIIVLCMLMPLSAHGQTAAELRLQINDLQERLADLQERLGELEAEEGIQNIACPYTWTRNLAQGSNGLDVRRLQQFLNGQANINVSVVGAGAPGQETTYYGPLTAAALARFQNREVTGAYQSGTFDTMTRQRANALCTSGSTQGAAALPEVRPQGVEGALTDFDAVSSNKRVTDDDIEEVLEFEVTAWNSVVSINRVDVLFEALDNILNERPWEFVDKVELRQGREVYKQTDASDRDHWTLVGVNGDNPVYRIRLRSFSAPVGADDTERFSIVLRTKVHFDSADLPQNFAVSIGEGIGSTEGLRGVDSRGVYHEIGDADDIAIVRFDN